MCQSNKPNKWDNLDQQDMRYVERESAKVIEARVGLTSQAIMKSCGIIPVRIKNTNVQNLGVDYIVDFPKERMFIDEKAAYRYWNKDLKTYAIEISNICNTVNHSGWFMNEKSITTHYLFVWPRSEDEAMTKLFRWEGLLIEKRLLKDLYYQIGYSKEELETVVREHGIQTKNTGMFVSLYDSYSNGERESVRVFLATGHREKNVNLVLPKSWLIPMASRHIIWERDKGIVLDASQTPEIPRSAQIACYQIRSKKNAQNEHKITA